MQFLLLSSIVIVHGLARKRVYPKIKSFSTENLGNVGDALILTPFINAGQLEKARKLSRVTNFTSVESYSGYFTVNETYNSNMFFWFFPAAFNVETAPVVLWLQGGPGGSSLFGKYLFRKRFSCKLHVSLYIVVL